MSRKIGGTAIVFGSRSVDLGFIEVILPKAVNRTFDERIDVRALAHHDASQLLGRLSSGTLKLARTLRGVDAEIDLPRTATGDAILELARRRDLTSWSFAFSRPVDTWELEPDGTVLRTLLDMRISEVSPVSWAAYEMTDLSVRGLERRGRSPAQEWSDDRSRGQTRHALIISTLRKMQQHKMNCTRCLKEPARMVRTTAGSVQLVCQRCASGASSLAMMEKRQKLAMAR